MAVTVNVPLVWQQGLLDPLDYVGNGQDVTSGVGSTLAAYVNMVSGRMRKLYWTGSELFANVFGATSQNVAAGYFKTSPYVGSVIMRCVCLPADSATATLQPRIHLYLLRGGEGGTVVEQPALHIGRRKTTAAVMNDVFTVAQRIDGKGGTTALVGDTEYAFWIVAEDNARVLSACLYEEPSNTIDATSVYASDTVVVPERFTPRNIIHNDALDDVQDTILQLYQKQAPVIVQWGAISGTAPTYVGTALTNVFSSSYSDWNSGAPGFTVRRQYCAEVNGTAIAVKIAVRAGGAIGGNAHTVRIRKTAGTDLATISVTALAPAFYTATANLDPTAVSEKLDVLYQSHASGGTVALYSFTVFETE